MDKYMEKAHSLAIHGIEKKEGGPFGAIIVDSNGNIVGSGNNRVLKNLDPTANIKTLYFGCTRKDAADIGFRDDLLYEYLKDNSSHKDLIQSIPLDRNDCLSIFKKYVDNNGVIY